jgi:hypothetical protein
VARYTVQNGPETYTIPVNYSPERQKLWNALVLLVRTYFNPHATEAAIGNQIHRIDRTIPRDEPSTVEQQLWQLGSKRPFQVEIFGLFSSLAIGLVGVGMYTAMSYGLRQPTHEIGM